MTPGRDRSVKVWGHIVKIGVKTFSGCDKSCICRTTYYKFTKSCVGYNQGIFFNLCTNITNSVMHHDLNSNLIEQIIFNSKTNYYTGNIFFVLEMKHCSDKLLIYLNSSVKFTRSRLFLVTYLSTRLLSAFVSTLPLWCIYFHYPYSRHGLFMNEIIVSWLGKDICNSMRFSF